MFQDILLIDADSIYFRMAMVTTKKNEIRKGIKATASHLSQKSKQQYSTVFNI